MTCTLLGQYSSKIPRNGLKYLKIFTLKLFNGPIKKLYEYRYPRWAIVVSHHSH